MNDRKIKLEYISIALTMIFIAVNVYLALNHEAWRDEGQAWTIVKNASLGQLLSILCVEGHPALWFITILPFAKFGLPFSCFFIVSLLFTAVSFYILLQYSPFPYPIRILLSFSSLFWYYNAVIPRIYSEIVLIVFLIALVYPKRNECPILYGILIFLLTQSHVLMEGLAIALVFERFCRLFDAGSRRNALPSFLAGTAGGLLALAEIYPRPGTSRAVDVSAGGILGNITAEKFSGMSGVFSNALWGFSSEKFLIIFFAVFVSAIIAAIVIGISRKNVAETLIFSAMAVISFVIPTFICLFVYVVHNHMATVFAAILLFLFWIGWDYFKSRTLKAVIAAPVILLSLLTMTNVVKDAAFDLSALYSNSKPTADYIIDNTEENSVVLVEKTEYNSPVISYVKDKRPDIIFYSAVDRKEYRYHIWGRTLTETAVSDAVITADAYFADRNVYWLRSWGVDDDSALTVELIQNEPNTAQEYYILYRVQ